MSALVMPNASAMDGIEWSYTWLTGQRIYTPVCLNMGTAVAVLASPEPAQIFLTYGATALSAEAAGTLIELIIAELGV